MALRRSIPLTFRPKGLSDAIDGTNAFPGAMQQLVNLIPAQSTNNIFVPRPAASQETDFTGFTTPSTVSALLVIGTVAYGMIGSGLNSGHDEPFAYDIAAASFISISGITSANTPMTQPTTGDWTPPSMAVIGTKIIVTHPGFDGSTHFFGVIDISTPASPAWSAGNTATNALPDIPTAVAQFNNRAYYAVNNQTWFSDALAATTITNASQVLTLGDTQDVTALAGLPLTTQLGGVVQALIAFKGDAIAYQITGDSTTSDLAINALNVAVGTLAANTVCPTSIGLAFIAPDGLRIIGFDGTVTDVIGGAGQGVNVPFVNVVNPSRMCAAFNNNILRVTVQNGSAPGQPFQEYWFDFLRKIWTGPHSFPAGLIEPYQGSPNHGFVMAPQAVPATLFSSAVIPTSTDSYVENGTNLAWTYQTVLLPDNQMMSENALQESTLAIALPINSTITVQALDEDNNDLDTVTINGPSGTPSVWGTMIWGTSAWGGPNTAFAQLQIPWSLPLVFKQASIRISGSSASGLAIGNMYLRYQPQGYLVMAT